MLTVFALPSGFVSDINSNATDVLSALGGPTTQIIGVLLGTLVIGFLISAVSHHK